MITITILLIPTVLILYKFPRIRGIIGLMIILLISLMFFLIMIETLIMPLPIGDIDLNIMKIPTNLLISLVLLIPILLLWYLFTIKYFWKEIDKMRKIEIET